MADEKDNQIVVLQPEDKGAVAVFRKKRHLMWANFLGGLSWGFGSVMGATLLVAIVLVMLKILGGIPLIGSYINDLVDAISATRQ